MSIEAAKADNLVKLLDGLSLLDDRDQERIISVVDALEYAGTKAGQAVCTGTPSADSTLWRS